MDLHIGILETGYVTEELVATHGSYPQMFEKLFAGLATEAKLSLRLATYDVQLRVPTEIECDAYVITGSRHSVYDDLPWIGQLADFVSDVLADGRRVVGVCFGHQLLAHFFGGRVAAAPQGWAVGIHHHEVLAEQPWMTQPAAAGTHIGLISSHKDQVLALPEGASVWLGNDFCPVGGFVMDNVVTVQGHPEFKQGYARALLEKRRGLVGEQAFQQGMSTLSSSTEDPQDTDAQAFGRWLLQFLAFGNTPC